MTTGPPESPVLLPLPHRHTAVALFCPYKATRARVLEIMVLTPAETASFCPSQILHMDSARAEESDFNDTVTQIWNHAYLLGPTQVPTGRYT